MSALLQILIRLDKALWKIIIPLPSRAEKKS